MTPEGWQQVDRLFQAAVELEPPRRASFLDEACAGDKTLRSEIESLLALDSREWDFIERPALESAASLLADEQPRLIPGQAIGHYEVLSLLGRGGMGEVYLARDRALNRKVALKLLPLDYTRDKDRVRRFQREAQAASALNHPNILTIHQLGEFDGQQFLATELIEGETLRTHLTSKQLTLRDALDLAIQTAGALAAAHKAGIVHRDIKPENIMLRPDGYVKVLDFGLAKLAEQHDTPSQLGVGDQSDASSGLMMGTVRYMSPEQARGEQVDARSDIFSLGVVLYEMIAGHAPFENIDPAYLLKSILNDEPPPLTSEAGTLPDKLLTIVNKALSKKRASRYQQVSDLLIELKLLKEELELGGKSSDTGIRSSGRPRTDPVSQYSTPLTGAASTKDTSPSLTTSTFEYAISQMRRPRNIVVTVILLSSLSLIGYASYKFLRQTRLSSLTADGSNKTGIWTTKAPISSSRSQVEPTVLNGVLYVAGGWNVCTPFADLESYDPVSDTWTQRAPMLTARGAHGAAVLNGLLYVVGGSVDCGVDIASVEAYNPATNTWSARASLPTARYNHVVAVARGKLYAIGGNSNRTGYFGLNTEYDPQTDSWIDRAPMPTPRIYAAAAVVNDIIYVIGGNGPSKTVEAYNPAGNTWTSKAPMLTARSDFAASVVNGIIYAFGGGRNSGEVEAYNPATDAWTKVAKMPAPRTSFHAVTFEGSIYFAGGFDGVNYLSSVMAFTPDGSPTANSAPCTRSYTWITKAPMPTMRGAMATGEINGILYVVGGDGGSFDYFSINEAYDPVSNKWTVRAPMPTARGMKGTNNAVVNGILYVIGGNPRFECTNVNEAYDPVTNVWTIRAPMPTARCHLAVVALNGLIYAIGGNSNNAYTSIVEVYNPTTNAWTTAPAMPTARQEFAAGVVNGMLYVVGGANQYGSLGTLEAYDPTTRTWTTKASMPTPRSGLAAGVLNGSLIVVGGENGRTSVGTVEAYDPSTDTWTTLVNMPTARFFLAAAAANNTLYVFGGGAVPDLPGSLKTNEAFNALPCSAQR